MCGIAGIVCFDSDFKNSESIYDKMCQTLKNRGPDAEGRWLCDNAAFLHTRLIVIDPLYGKQPMIKKRGSNTYVLTYNGELYNTNEVRSILKARGYFFDGHSDTEVVITAYLEWGEKCVEYFNGIFAFAIWDLLEQKLFMARDRMGVKPLFYSEIKNGIVFGSEIKTLLAHPDIPPKIDNEGLAELFLIGPARVPGSGVFKNIKELEPAHIMTFNKKGMKIKNYWQLEAMPYNESLDETVERLKFLVEDSIERQLVSDVPICTFLSGGLDSSIITAVASEYCKKKNIKPIETYSIDYLDNDKNFKASLFQPDSDTPWIKIVSDYLGTNHKTVTIDTPELANALYDATMARDLPGMADVDSSLYLFCREVKKNATVALSGECADEIFGGYPWYYKEEMLYADTFPWARSTVDRQSLLKVDVLNGINAQDFVLQKYLDSIKKVPKLKGESEYESRMREMFCLNIWWFMTTLLDRKDRMSMASGLEVRVPFCDHRIVEYAYNIPFSVKLLGEREKGLLRFAMLKTLPCNVVYRKKSPYPKTHNESYNQMVKSILKTILENKSSPLLNILDYNKIRELIETDGKSFKNPWFGQLMTAPQIFAYLIQLNYWFLNYKVGF